MEKEQDNNRLTIYIDGWCKYCQRLGKWVDRLDFLNNVRIQDIRNSSIPPNIDKEKSSKTIASFFPKNNRIYYGFDTLYQISLRVPLFWICIPLLFIFKHIKIGDYLYKEMAIRRTIIPFHCNQDKC